MNSENNSNHPSDWETCVVCGDSVEPGRGAARINHLGNTVNLCGPACRETFAQEPDPYLARLARRMREQVLRESLRFDGCDGSPEPVLHGSVSHNVLGAKRDLVKCVAVALVLASFLMASATTALSADVLTNSPAGSLTNAAIPLQAPHKEGTAATSSLSGVRLSPLRPGTSVANGLDGDLLQPGAGLLDWCVQGSSNLLTHAAVACCALIRPLGEGIDWKMDGVTKARSGPGSARTFRFFDGAVISGSRSGESYRETDRPSTFSTGSISGGDWLGPGAARKSQGLRLFSWSW
jgi:ribosomal protein L24E